MLIALIAVLPLAGQPIEIPSHAHRMSTTFDHSGIRVHGSGWGVGLALEEWGRAGSLVAATAAEPTREGRRVRYEHGLLTEWYVNEPRGLEQGFTITSRPEGAGPLRIVLSVDGAFTAEVLPGGRDARFANSSGETVLHYVGLHAFDAVGGDLEARLVAKEGRLSIVVEDQGAAYPVHVDPWMGTELAMLLPSDPERELVGDCLSISGDTFVTGAPGVGVAEGAAYVWERDANEPSGWREVTKLLPSQPESFSRFGEAVDIEGDLIAVGQPADVPWGSDEGAVYVFERDQGGPDAWGEIGRIRYNFTEDGFGRSVSILGDTLVVGAPREGVGFGYYGAVYIYGRDVGGPGAWGFVARLDSPTPSDADYFGGSLALSGDRLFVGSPGDSVAAYIAGAVYVYERNEGGPNAWGEVQQLRASDPATYTHFGASLAQNEDVLLVGATAANHSGLENAGAVYAFERTGGTWSEVQKLTPDVPLEDEGFGRVSLSGDTALIGSSDHDLPGLSNAGGAYLFRRQGAGASWTQVDLLHASNPQAGAVFGQAVDIDGSTGLAGAAGLDLGYQIGSIRAIAVDPANGTVYAADYHDQIVTLDTATGAGTPVGPIGFGDIHGMAFDPGSGLLYGIDVGNDLLLTIDPATGAGSAIGPVSFSTVSCLALDTNQNVLYGCDKLTDTLVAIDPNTAVTTAVGPTGDFVTGLTFDPLTGTLYGSDPLTNELVTIDTSTGAMTTVGKLGFINVQGLAFDSQARVLHGFDVKSFQLIRIDPATGAGTAIGGPAPTYEANVGAVYVFGITFGSETYCTAGISASDCQAQIGATGVASASAPSGFVLSATNVEGAKAGHFYFAFNGRRASTWGNGTSFQCVEPPVKRGGPQPIAGTAGACDGWFTEDLNARWTAKPAQNPGAGAMGQAQLWYRDPQNTSNQTTSLSNAVEFHVQP